jgi:hypothetical protein
MRGWGDGGGPLAGACRGEHGSWRLAVAGRSGRAVARRGSCGTTTASGALRQARVEAAAMTPTATDGGSMCRGWHAHGRR